MIHVVTDSTAQLTDKQIKDNNIEVIPLDVTIDGKDYEDGVDITREQFSDHLANDDEFPKTSQPPIGKFIEMYEKIQKEDPKAQIISIHLCKILSGTVETAQVAANQVGGDITVIDSDSVDSGLGFEVMKAAELISDGKTYTEVVDGINNYIPEVKTYVFVKSFDYLVKGGRANRAVGFVSSLIKLMPVLQVTDYKFKLEYKCRGVKKLNKIRDEFTQHIINDKSISQVGLSYVDDPSDAEEIAEQIRKARPDIDVRTRLTSPIVMTHVGPHGFGYIWA